MPLSNSEIATMASALGTGDATMQAAVTSVPANIKTSRNTVVSFKSAGPSDTDFDSASTLENSLRGLETTLATNIKDQLKTACQALEAYALKAHSAKFRIAYKTVTASQWTDNFRTLWARTMAEELIVRLHQQTNDTGTWSSTDTGNNETLSIDSTLEIRLSTITTPSPPTVTAAEIVVNMTLTHLDSINEVVQVTIPAGSSYGATFPITGVTPSKFLGISSVSVTGGSDEDRIEIWVR